MTDEERIKFVVNSAIWHCKQGSTATPRKHEKKDMCSVLTVDETLRSLIIFTDGGINNVKISNLFGNAETYFGKI